MRRDGLIFERCRQAAFPETHPASFACQTVDARTNLVSTTISVGNYPAGAAVAPDGTVYVANYGDGTVSVIKGDRVTATISVGKNPVGAAVAPDGSVYVTNAGDGTVSVLR